MSNFKKRTKLKKRLRPLFSILPTSRLIIKCCLVAVVFLVDTKLQYLFSSLSSLFLSQRDFFVNGVEVTLVNRDSSRNIKSHQGKKAEMSSTKPYNNAPHDHNNNSNDDEMEITQEMIDLILRKVKPGGGSSDPNSNIYANDLRKKKKRKRKYPSNTASSSSSSSASSSSSSSRSSSRTNNGNNNVNPLDAISTTVTVTIPGYGKAEGRRETAVDIWKGIPYASPPVGSLRFAPPEAAPPWAPSKLDASKFGPDCYQLVDPVLNPLADIQHMSEDCLYLNVFTPAGHAGRSRQGKFLSGSKLLPVMVWLHGGAFQQGGARRPEYDGRKLAERDIIVVSINYRLGALGFMVSSSDGMYGNYGLMDQRCALHWVKNNIEAFGGDPENITLFGESAGAVMIGLHLLMDGAGTLFHKAIMQSNPLGYRFRSVVIADFIGEALKRTVDCRDLACLRAERVEEIMRAQSSLMGVPRSVGDFFTWGPTLTNEMKIKFSLTGNNRLISRTDENRLPRLDNEVSKNSYISEWRFSGDESTSDRSIWSGVNVSQPLKMTNSIPDHIPIMIGTNQHEGEMFVHAAFPAPMPKPVYWMFVGALFRDSASRILRHYRGLVDEVEREAEEVAKKQMEEEENKQEYLENKDKLDNEYEMLLAMNETKRGRSDDIDVIASDGLKTLMKTWSTGGYLSPNEQNVSSYESDIGEDGFVFTPTEPTRLTLRDRWIMMAKVREEKRLARMKLRALKEAAKVNVDYRPVMSAIINDYLFRCPSWHFAQLLSANRAKRNKHDNNVFVYRFSLPTHIPGYRECWGKSCHTAELPYVFQAMDVIRSNYSTLGPFAQKEAPHAPDYPYTQIMAAYRGALEAVENYDDENEIIEKQSDGNGFVRNHTKAFQRILDHFFGDYFKEDADEEMASDMSERWASFARQSNPNYEGSRAKWLPWRHRSENSTFFNTDEVFDGEQDMLPDWEDYDYWIDEYDSDVDEESEQQTIDEFYRENALELMQMDVVAEDMYRTELKRTQYRKESEDEDTSFLKGKVWKRWNKKNGRQFPPMARLKANEARRLAQNFGVMGIGLSDDRNERDGPSEIYFPELLELTWPPEGRLIERDCTCDLWDRIRYRY